MKSINLVLPLVVMAIVLAACARNVKADPGSRTIAVTETTQADNPTFTPSADCPVTVPQDPPFVPPSPYDDLGFEENFWYGSNSLWTAVPRDGTWRALPHNPGGYTQKVFWWREGYSISEEPQPALTLTAERLDGKVSPVTGSKATNASAGDIGSAMLVGVDLPTLGCWKITGKYEGKELSFVVQVAP